MLPESIAGGGAAAGVGDVRAQAANAIAARPPLSQASGRDGMLVSNTPRVDTHAM